MVTNRRIAKNGYQLAVLFFIFSSLSGCYSAVLTGAQMYYERYQLKKTLKDSQLTSKAHLILRKYKNHFKDARVYVVVFNGDILLLGQVPTQKQKALAYHLVNQVEGKRRLFNELKIGQAISKYQMMKDSWITVHLKSQMLVNDHLNQKAFKVTTEDGVVYILGDVRRQQANLVVAMARKISGVRKVIRAMRYLYYE